MKKILLILILKLYEPFRDYVVFKLYSDLCIETKKLIFGRLYLVFCPVD